jgi:DNA-binding NtrC family response regulator
MARGILIVDDDASTLVYLKKLLEKNGYQTLLCEDEEFAMEMLKPMEFPLVILDINLPQINGWEILKYIKDEAPETCVLIITGTKNAKTAEFEEKYADTERFMISYKPFIAKDFLIQVREIIDNNNKTEQLLDQ